MSKKGGLVIALGGNAISKPGKHGTIQDQFYATYESMEHIAELVSDGFDRLVVTHGNGPQVGASILRSEIAAKSTYPLPMDICVADTQGGMGYMIQQVLKNTLKKRKISTPVATIVSQALVDLNDPAFENPTKPIGMFYTEKEANELRVGRGWTMKEDAGRGFRRVVPSPKPIKILEVDVIKALFDKGFIVIAGGGGGVPIGLNRQGLYYGIEAVIDKDLTSALIAAEVGADTLVILTAVEFAYLDFLGENKRALTEVKVEEMQRYLNAGEFQAGSMKPKVEAALNFLEGGGKKAIITSLSNCLAALHGRTGTHITK
ncbi:MAG TPA: carbamate kinase [bacterium]|nr:carbamate kinase [Myxococcales bacterium]HPW46137.1 carbamate kinase [bacterium]HQC50744.1 carbamate kinase [bacterium]